jgi:DNA-binding response OmpR family regulator
MEKYNRLKELTTLYVEDDKDISEEIIDILQLKVKKVFSASNGEEAIEIYKKENIDIIITDIQMPIMDGLTMLQSIREVDEEIPVIITSAFTETSFLKKAIDLHVDKYIVKPIDIEQLLSVLDRASEVIFQKREIESRDLVIKTILDMHPYYSIIIDEKKIQNIRMELLSFLGYQCSDDFSFSHVESNGKCKVFSSIDALIDLMISMKQNNLKEELVCLKPKNKDATEFILKPYYFEGTNLFLMAFFEEKIIVSEALQNCISHPTCKSCKL